MTRCDCSMMVDEDAGCRGAVSNCSICARVGFFTKTTYFLRCTGTYRVPLFCAFPLYRYWRSTRILSQSHDRLWDKICYLARLKHGSLSISFCCVYSAGNGGIRTARSLRSAPLSGLLIGYLCLANTWTWENPSNSMKSCAYIADTREVTEHPSRGVNERAGSANTIIQSDLVIVNSSGGFVWSMCWALRFLDTPPPPAYHPKSFTEQLESSCHRVSVVSLFF